MMLISLCMKLFVNQAERFDLPAI